MKLDSTVLSNLSPSNLPLPKGYVFQSILIALCQGIVLAIEGLVVQHLVKSELFAPLVLLLCLMLLSLIPLHYGWRWHQALREYRTSGEVWTFKTLKTKPLEFSLQMTLIMAFSLGWVLPLGAYFVFFPENNLLGGFIAVLLVLVLFVVAIVQRRHGQQLLAIQRALLVQI